MSPESPVVGGLKGAGATKSVVPVDVTSTLSGGRVRLWLHIVEGARPGPTLSVISGMHGAEWFSIPALRTLVENLDPDEMAGTLIVAPVANPPALGLNTRNMPDESDSPDLNRIFPGTHTWTTDQIAAAITRHVLEPASVVVDLHMGPWGSAFCDVLVGQDYPSPTVVETSQRLALAFGSPIVRKANVVTGFPGPRSAIGYAGGVLGIPAIAAEVGGAGFSPQLEGQWKRQTVDGLLAVMAEMEMLPERSRPKPPEQLIYSTAHRVNPSRAGILRSRFGGDKLATAVSSGQILGEVTDPYTFEVVEELIAPAAGLLFYTSRDYPVRPGDWAFGIAATDQGSVSWVRNGGGA